MPYRHEFLCRLTTNIHIAIMVENYHIHINQWPIHLNNTMPKITHKELPIEAHQTLKDIDKGGPFPYAKDGTTFHNRENKLHNTDRIIIVNIL